LWTTPDAAVKAKSRVLWATDVCMSMANPLCTRSELQVLMQVAAANFLGTRYPQCSERHATFTLASLIPERAETVDNRRCGEHRCQQGIGTGADTAAGGVAVHVAIQPLLLHCEALVLDIVA